jgi:hypothetical protein
MMTDEEKKYRDGYGQICPRCGRRAIDTVDTPTSDFPMIYQWVECSSCKLRFEEKFAFVGIQWQEEDMP